MRAQFRYLDGALAGQVKSLTTDFATVGRHPSSDLPFDPQLDLEVSARHAAIFRQGDGFVVRDLGSTNGTFVNGARIRHDQPLKPNDVVRFGARGPQVVFLLEGTPAPAGPIPETAGRWVPPSPAPSNDPLPPRPLAPSAPGRTTERIRFHVQRETSRWRVVILATLGVALAGGWLGWISYRRSHALEVQRTRLLAQVDSLITRLQGTTANVASLEAALTQGRNEAAALRKAIVAEGISAERLAALAREVTANRERQRHVLDAATLDTKAIAADNAQAVAVVLAQFPGERKVSGTGFAVRSRGDTVWVVTSRHLVSDSARAGPVRLGVVFNYSGQNFRAEVAAKHDSLDLAVLLVPVRGGAAVVRAIASRASPGEPVAIVGFPQGLGNSTSGDWTVSGVSAITIPGTLLEIGATLLRIDGYGTQGTSGSPVFSAKGEVLGVVSGGEPQSGGRTVFAVPGRFVRELIR